MSEKMIIVDGNSIFFKAYYNGPVIEDATNVLKRFEAFMLNVIKKEMPACVVVAFSEKVDFISRMLDIDGCQSLDVLPKEYKVQEEKLKRDLRLKNIQLVENTEYEVKDICYFIMQKADAKEYRIVTADMILLQLISDTCKLLVPSITGEGCEISTYNRDSLQEMQWENSQIVDYFALLDQVDGLGDRSARKLLSEYGDIASIISAKEQVFSSVIAEKIVNAEEKLKNRQMLLTATSIPEFVFVNEAVEIDMEAWSGSKDQEVYDEVQSEKIENNTTEIKYEEHIVTNLAEMTNCINAIEALPLDKENVSMQLFVDSDFYEHYFEEDLVVETGGQLSLFAITGSDSKALLKAASMAVGKDAYYFEFMNDVNLEKTFSQWIFTLIEKEVGFSMFQLKEHLYIFNKLAKQYGMDGTLLNADTMRNCMDLSVAGYLLDPAQESYEYHTMSSVYLNKECIGRKEFFGKKSWEEKNVEDKEGVVKHCLAHSKAAHQIREVLIKQLEETEQEALYRKVEFPLIFVLYEMEQRGIRVNKEELREYGERLSVRIRELETVIYEQAGEEFNINSPKQLGVILFEKLQLPNGKKTKTGYSTSAEVLDKLKQENKIVADILEYRQLTKLKSTYADGLANYICTSDGRIHGKFNQTITTTGRLSSTDPNLQNIPIRMEIGREIRKVFIPKDGYVFLDADYSQIELRILAHMSGDENLIQAYNSGKDIHRITASQVFHTPFEEVTREQRSNAKAVNFGIVYGISSFGLGQDLNISRKEAEQYIARYFETYPGIKKYLDGAVEKGKELGYAVSLMGRRRYIKELAATNFVQRSFGERIAMNSPIQGTAADIMKIAMVRVNDRIKNEGLQSQLLLQIHDELLVETHPDELDEVKKILEEEMFGAMKMDVPLEVEVEQGANWNEAH